MLVLLIWVALIAVRKWTATEAGPLIPGRLMRPHAGSVEVTLRVSGNLTAERASALLAPRMRGRRSRSSGSRSDFQIVLERMAPAGSPVRQGDFVASFDRQYMLNRLDDYRADVEQRRGVLARVEAGIHIARGLLEQRIHAAQALVDKARLDMRTIPVRSAIASERLRLALEEAQAYRRELDVERRYFDASERAELRRQQLLLAEEELELRRAETNAARMVFSAPIPGIVVPSRMRRGQEYDDVRPGDEVRAGYPFVQIVDPSSLTMAASLNQVDAQLVRTGMRARIRVDAVTSVEMPGHVAAIGSIAAGTRYRPDWVRQLPIKIAPDSLDPRVFPNFSASADIVLQSAEGLVAPRECISSRDGNSGRIRLWDGREARAVDVRFGLESATETIVEAGLTAGETMVCGFAGTIEGNPKPEVNPR
ncbi:MAG: efflux RND transporter periplasmic adaptor subunit [Bryobacteraceae bacterium]